MNTITVWERIRLTEFSSLLHLTSLRKQKEDEREQKYRTMHFLKNRNKSAALDNVSDAPSAAGRFEGKPCALISA